MLPFETKEWLYQPIILNTENLAIMKPPFPLLPFAAFSRHYAGDLTAFELLDQHIIHIALTGVQLSDIDDPREFAIFFLPEKHLLLKERWLLSSHFISHDVISSLIRQRNYGFVKKKGRTTNYDAGQNDRA